MSLTQTAEKTRRAIVYFGFIVVIYYLSILVVIPATTNMRARLFPPKDPPTLLYGNLPQLAFTEKQINNAIPPKVLLDTKDGKLPSGFPAKMTVYKFKKPVPLFQKGKEALEDANFLGYSDNELISSLKESVYKFKSVSSGGYLEINTDTKEIRVDIPISVRGEFYPIGQLTTNTASGYARSLLASIGRFDDPLYSSGTQVVKLGKISNTRLIEAATPFDAQVARVDFFRNINNVPILGPDPTYGLIHMIIRKPQNENKIYNIAYMDSHIWELEQQSSATYPIISVEQAWLNVSQAKGVITNVTPKTEALIKGYQPVELSEIFITNIYLAYYDSPQLQQYLQPIYVFEGTYTAPANDGGKISIYYPAILPEHISTN